jgi:hypothetical protein
MLRHDEDQPAVHLGDWDEGLQRRPDDVKTVIDFTL